MNKEKEESVYCKYGAYIHCHTYRIEIEYMLVRLLKNKSMEIFAWKIAKVHTPFATLVHMHVKSVSFQMWKKRFSFCRFHSFCIKFQAAHAYCAWHRHVCSLLSNICPFIHIFCSSFVAGFTHIMLSISDNQYAKHSVRIALLQSQIPCHIHFDSKYIHTSFVQLARVIMWCLFLLEYLSEAWTFGVINLHLIWKVF